VARETRSQRRAKRRQSGDSPVVQRARSRQQQLRPSAQPVSNQTGRRERRERGKFIKESWGELKKVEWPGRPQVVQGTVVVIIACAIVGAYLYGADQILRRVVQQVFLGN